jgi:hypothetical protein
MLQRGSEVWEKEVLKLRSFASSLFKDLLSILQRGSEVKKH